MATSAPNDETSEEKMHWQENYDDVGEFFFESDHLALKGNPDYHNLLKVIAMLEAQRTQAVQDLDTLHQGLQEALADPLKFVERLQKKVPMNFPEPQRIVQLPTINWNKYSLGDGSQPPLMLSHRPQLLKSESALSKDPERDRVRGRLYNPSKPSSFNQLWTSQEQKKLEELLVLHPPEEVESRRWEKISKALGTRTPAQVASRVQKYFIHLSKAGLAVPGRAPRRSAVLNSGRLGVHRMNMLRMTSSFFKHHVPSVYMMDTQDLEDVPCPASTSQSSSDMPTKESGMEEDDPEKEDESLSKGGMWENPLYQELLFLQKLKQDRAGTQPLVQHIGFQCDRCQCDPIVGIRWHCADCPSQKSVDFCSDCVDCQEEIGTHTADHKLEPIDQASSTMRPFLDGDYLHLMGSGQYCNYLDPNYMPATSETG